MTTLETHQPLNRPMPPEKEEVHPCRFTTDRDAAFFVRGLLFDDKTVEDRYYSLGKVLLALAALRPKW